MHRQRRKEGVIAPPPLQRFVHALHRGNDLLSAQHFPSDDTGARDTARPARDEENILAHVLVACFAGIGVVGVLSMVNAGSDFESMFDALFLTVVGMIFIYRGGYSLVDDTD